MSMMPSDSESAHPKRKPIPKRVRYEVLRRDNYTCRYCRATDSKLTVDHVVPHVLGGSDDPSNLVAACVDCNAGKSSSSPDASLVAQATEDSLRWSAAVQVAAGKMRDDFQGEWDYAEALDDEWSNWTYGSSKHPIPRPSDWRNSAGAWRAAGLPVDLLIDAAQRALGNPKIAPHDTWKYFCGIAWKRITQIQEAAKASMADPEEADVDCDGQHDCECESIAYYKGVDSVMDRHRTAYSTLNYYAVSRVVDAEGWAWRGVAV
jgi:hypothetical protein